ncbi:hypothetical protein L798_13355 [Zootermopsis nevadensis]|uniref:Uncharacterized protein n=1 Tax=Zootermopsis nevadensis TaxID=136037 RepID=A0A067RS82_ZOONE|nr:hypothetical protein L798_13355 [Zootermopsis nevadensis]
MSSSLGVRQWFPAGDLARHARDFGIAFVGEDKEEDGVLKTECVSPPPLIPLSTDQPEASDDSEEPGAYGGVFMVNSESPVFGGSAVVNMCSEGGCCAGDASRCSVVLDPLPSDLLRSLTEDGRISAEKAAREQCSSVECVAATQDRIDCGVESRDSRRGARHRKRRLESGGGGKGKRRKRSTSCSTTSSTGSTASRSHHHHHKHHKHRRRRSKTADEGSPLPTPRVNPIFVWVKQDDTRIVEVLCEDYDKRNRIRLTKTPHGWRAIPRTERLVSVSQTTPSSTSNCSVEAPLDERQCDNLPTDDSIDHYVTTLVSSNDHPAPVAEDENSIDQITKEENAVEEVEDVEGEIEAEENEMEEGEKEKEEEEDEVVKECPENEVNGEETCDNTTHEQPDSTETVVEEMVPTDLSIPKTTMDKDDVPVKSTAPALSATKDAQPTPVEATPTPAHQPKPQHQSMFLESLLSSPRKCHPPPKLANDEPQPLDLGVSLSRGSGSPTVSCSEERKSSATTDPEVKPTSECIKAEDITLKNLLSKQSAKVVERSPTPEAVVETTKAQKSRLLELLTSETFCLDQELDPVTQLKKVLSDPELSVPDPMLVPRDRLRRLVASPAREIPRLLSTRPELRLPDALAYPALVRDPDLLVVSLAHLQRLLQNWTEEDASSCMILRDYQIYQQQHEAAISEFKQQQQNGELAAALNQMLWLPYLTQLEATAMACGNNQDFLTMLNAVFPPSSYPQVRAGAAQQQYPFLAPFTLPSTDYKTQLEFQQALATWHEAMMHAAVSTASVNNNNNLLSGKNASGTNTYNKNHHQHATNGRFPHVAKKFNSSSARTSPISPSFQPRVPNNTHEYLAANGYTNNHHRQYNQHRPRHHHQQHQQPARNNSGLPKLPKSETQTPTDVDKKPKVTCKSLINLLSNSKKQQQEESVTIKRCVSPATQTQHSHLLAALGNPPSNLPRLVPIPQGMSPPTPIDLSGRRPGDREAVATGKLKVKKHLVDPAITPRLLKQEADAISPTEKTSHPHLWHPLFGSQKTPYISPWQWTTVMVNGE